MSVEPRIAGRNRSRPLDRPLPVGENGDDR